jgi:hypothetical protein
MALMASLRCILSLLLFSWFTISGAYVPAAIRTVSTRTGILSGAGSRPLLRTLTTAAFPLASSTQPNAEVEALLAAAAKARGEANKLAEVLVTKTRLRFWENVVACVAGARVSTRSHAV